MHIIVAYYKYCNMRETSYGEKKQRITLTITPTVKKWLKQQQKRLCATSLSDTLEKMARYETAD